MPNIRASGPFKNKVIAKNGSLPRSLKEKKRYFCRVFIGRLQARGKRAEAPVGNHF